MKRNQLVWLFSVLLLIANFALVGIAFSESEDLIRIDGVFVLVSLPRSGDARIENASFLRQMETNAEGMGYSSEYSGQKYKVSIFADGGEIYSSGTIDNPRKDISTRDFFFPALPEDATGKKLEAVLQENGKIVDRKAILYCGDKVCSKGERVTTCPSDCILGGLAPQQASKQIPYIAAGLILIVLAGFVFFVVTRQRQQ